VITVQDLARLAGTIPYDILCGLRGRCEVVGVP
jgi:alanine racemase